MFVHKIHLKFPWQIPNNDTHSKEHEVQFSTKGFTSLKYLHTGVFIRVSHIVKA